MREKREKRARKRYLRLIQEIRLYQMIAGSHEFIARLFEQATKIERRFPAFTKEAS